MFRKIVTVDCQVKAEDLDVACRIKDPMNHLDGSGEPAAHNPEQVSRSYPLQGDQDQVAAPAR